MHEINQNSWHKKTCEKCYDYKNILYSCTQKSSLHHEAIKMTQKNIYTNKKYEKEIDVDVLDGNDGTRSDCEKKKGISNIKNKEMNVRSKTIISFFRRISS